MAFTFGREKMSGRSIRVRPRSFWDWEKTEGVLTPQWYDPYTHKEGTPMRLEPATQRNVSRAIHEINGFEWEGDFKPLARRALKELLERGLDEEMAQHLGVSRYERGSDRHDYRNGHYVRHLLTEMGDLELLVPRSRKGKFPPGFLSAMHGAVAPWTGCCWLVFVWDSRRERLLQCWLRF